MGGPCDPKAASALVLPLISRILKNKILIQSIRNARSRPIFFIFAVKAYFHICPAFFLVVCFRTSLSASEQTNRTHFFPATRSMQAPLQGSHPTSPDSCRGMLGSAGRSQKACQPMICARPAQVPLRNKIGSDLALSSDLSSPPYLHTLAPPTLNQEISRSTSPLTPSDLSPPPFSHQIWLSSSSSSSHLHLSSRLQLFAPGHVWHVLSRRSDTNHEVPSPNSRVPFDTCPTARPSRRTTKRFTFLPATSTNCAHDPAVSITPSRALLLNWR